MDTPVRDTNRRKVKLAKPGDRCVWIDKNLADAVAPLVASISRIINAQAAAIEQNAALMAAMAEYRKDVAERIARWLYPQVKTIGGMAALGHDERFQETKVDTGQTIDGQRASRPDAHQPPAAAEHLRPADSKADGKRKR
jgi:hypothetical protein